MEINKEILEELLANKLLLEEYYILSSSYNNIDWGYKPFGLYYTRLIQKGLLDTNFNLTAEGKTLYEKLINIKKPITETEFEEF